MHNEEINQGIIEASSKQIQERYKKKNRRKIQEKQKKDTRKIQER